MYYRPTYLKVNLDNLNHNLAYLANYSKKAIFAVFKADAYGLGAVPIIKHLPLDNVTYLAVSSLDEALYLRQHGIKHPILLFGYVAITDTPIALKYDLTLSVNSLDWTLALTQAEVKGLKLHLKVDTGMHRIGIIELSELKQALALLKDQHQIEGIYTHYAKGDDLVTTTKQFERFKAHVLALNYPFKWIHSANSSGMFTLKEDFTNAVRPGLAMYGYLDEPNLKPVASLFSQISQIKLLAANEPISYNGLYHTQTAGYIATLPIGYADGINPLGKNRQVYLANNYYPIVGSICMDQLMFAVDQPYPTNTEVEIFGEHLTMAEYCLQTGEIPYHVIAHLTPRVNRLYYQNKQLIDQQLIISEVK